MKWLLPPVLWLVLLAAVIALAALAPWRPVAPPPWHWSGAAFVAFGVWLLLAASGQFRRVRTNINTFRDPNILVADGLFGFTRNPMYLGFTLTLLGAAILSNAASALAAPLLFFFAANFWYVPFEERAAAAQFGEAYAAYCKRVRRWL
ncbi:MAG TPA: isoprenylcysteine carboxylmethyltransferase family protein [Vitreimonas sp.]|uniref:methyltransferase family protein n=1 Tax=Vitreimonas sp. TaxID=3069702 RepID=UPI002D75279D|nr:isoprenylcysteine carboxylmethyltransferase family protein [Vitreimonas sp.]HYD86371.1 isoprenylcysteine carboxylmethyltransferase family protein [Vitreimonas sp.]